MTKKIMQMVTQPYHGADGMSVLYQPGEMFPQGADLPGDLRVRDVVVDTEATAPQTTETVTPDTMGGPAVPELGGKTEQADRTGDKPGDEAEQPEVSKTEAKATPDKHKDVTGPAAEPADTTTGVPAGKASTPTPGRRK